MRLYFPGDHVTFRDPNGNIVDGQDSLSNGIVNADPWRISGRTLIPVWCERDNGREPTTIMVDESNIVTVRRSE